MQAASRTAVGVASACVAALLVALPPKHADADAARREPAEPQGSPAQLEALHAWLRARGARVDGVRVAPRDDRGLALVATAAPSSLPSWLRPSAWLRTPGCELASFPLHSALTLATCVSDPRLGASLAGWLAQDELSEREAMQLFLLVQRALGPASSYEPYVSLLATPTTPLHWQAGEMDELRGTALWEAVRAQQKQCAATWQRVAPLARGLLAQCGAKDAAALVAESDWRWAVSVFWSRSLLFPDPMRPSEALAEGIVPGLDFCNHGGARANATWAVEVQPRSRGAVVDAQEAPRHEFVIRDTPWRSRGIGAGTEVVINYGDGRSCEEMLFCYGFCAEPQNASDALLVTPLLSDPDDETTHARHLLLMHRGMEPRAFLPATGLRSIRDVHAAVEEALRMLTIWALSPAEVSAALGMDAAGLDDLLRRHRAGALLLLQRTLEQRHAALLVTGTPESDDKLLASGGGSQRLRSAVAYRRTQKRLAARYLAIARHMVLQ